MVFTGNQWTGFYMIGTSVMKDFKFRQLLFIQAIASSKYIKLSLKKNPEIENFATLKDMRKGYETK